MVFLWGCWIYPTHFYSSSVAYSPKVTFSANTLLTFATSAAFGDIVVDRPTPLADVTILLDNVFAYSGDPGPGGPSNPENPYGWPPGFSFTYLTSYGYLDFNVVWDLSQPGSHPEVINGGGEIYATGNGGTATVDIVTNADTLNITRAANAIVGLTTNIYANTGAVSIPQNLSPTITQTINVYGNAGTLTAHTYHSNVSVFGNSGTLNFLEGSNTFSSVQDSLIDIGGNYATSSGSLANIHGAINIAGENTWAGNVGILIDDRGNSGTPVSWTIDQTHIQVGNLAINAVDSNLGFYSYLDEHWRTGTHVTLIESPPFSSRDYYNGNGPEPFPIPLGSSHGPGEQSRRRRQFLVSHFLAAAHRHAHVFRDRFTDWLVAQCHNGPDHGDDACVHRYQFAVSCCLFRDRWCKHLSCEPHLAYWRYDHDRFVFVHRCR